MASGDAFDSHAESNVLNVVEQFWQEWETEYAKFVDSVRVQWKKEETQLYTRQAEQENQSLAGQSEEKQQFKARCEAQSEKMHILRKGTKTLLPCLIENLKLSLRQDTMVLEAEEHLLDGQRLPSKMTQSKPGRLPPDILTATGPDSLPTPPRGLSTATSPGKGSTEDPLGTKELPVQPEPADKGNNIGDESLEDTDGSLSALCTVRSEAGTSKTVTMLDVLPNEVVFKTDLSFWLHVHEDDETFYVMRCQTCKGYSFKLFGEDNMRSFQNHLTKCRPKIAEIPQFQLLLAYGTRIVDATMDWYLQREQVRKRARKQKREREPTIFPKLIPDKIASNATANSAIHSAVSRDGSRAETNGADFVVTRTAGNNENSSTSDEEEGDESSINSEEDETSKTTSALMENGEEEDSYESSMGSTAEIEDSQAGSYNEDDSESAESERRVSSKATRKPREKPKFIGLWFPVQLIWYRLTLT
jgi:hypothetical protein